MGSPPSADAPGAAPPRPPVLRGVVRSALLGLFVAALAVLVNGTELFRAFELRTVDLRFRLRGTREVTTPLAIVFIGDDSIAGLGRWPWGWDQHALMIDALRRAGARLVLFDVLFAEAPSRADEQLLAATARMAGNVHFISAFGELDAPAAGGEALFAGGALTEPLPALRAAAAGIGHANALPDGDGTTRRVPLAVRRGGALYPSLALGAAASYLGVPREGVRLLPGGRGIELRPPGGAPVVVPVDDDGTTPVTYPGGTESFPVRFSFLQVLQADAFPEQAAVDLRLLKDRIVLVGATFTGNTDLRPTPFSATYPMLLVQAAMIDSILRGEYIRRPAPGVSIAICILLGALLGAVSFTFRPLESLGFTLLAGGGYAAAAVLAFTRRGWQLELVPPLTAILAAYLLVTTAQYIETRAEKLRALERLTYLGHLVESAAEAIFSFGPAGVLASWNAGAARVYGYAEEEVLGRHWSLLAGAEAREAIEQALARVAAGGSANNLELELARKDGVPIPVEISFARILDSRGQVTGTSAISQDLTEKKRMLEVLIQSEKLAEIGRMGSGIVHEIKNPLTSIMMMSDIILATGDAPEKTRKYADIIQKESQRILRLSQNILSFARPQKPEMKRTDLSRVLADTLGLTEYEMKKAKVRVREQFDPAAPPVWGDGEKLKQVFLNLVMNAGHAMPAGGELEVRTLAPGREPPPRPAAGPAPWAASAVGETPPGPFVTAQVADHGTGIPAAIIARIFEPFFSTKGEGKGTGLGLYISRNIVLEHKGRIEVASAPGVGTVFTLQLPAAAAGPAGDGERPVVDGEAPVVDGETSVG